MSTKIKMQNNDGKVVIRGNTGRKANLIFKQNGDPQTTISVAVNDRYIRNGEQIETTTWYDVVLTRGCAESVAENGIKGLVEIPNPEVNIRPWKKDGKLVLDEGGDPKFSLTIYINDAIAVKETRTAKSGSPYNVTILRRAAAGEEILPGAVVSELEPDDIPF